MNDNLKGALWILVAATCAAGMSLSIRGMDGQIPIFQVVFVRCVVGVVLILAFSARHRSIEIFTPQWKWMVLRSCMTMAALVCGFTAISLLPLTTATVLFFTAPLYVTILSVPFFGETVGWRRAMATLAGFIGTIIVLRPGISGFDPNMLFAIGSSVLFAGVLLLGKRLSKTDTISTMMIYAMVISGLGSLPLAYMQWQTPIWQEWVLMLAVAGFGTLRGFSDTKGYATGEASVMAPFQYSRIVVVAIAAYLLFGEVPDLPTLIGAAIIIGSSLYIAHRESKLSKGGAGAPKTGVAAP